ncbi:major facilitator superfamily domain-containing protein [Xylariaceae sp. FL0804]|nr:major facilitator superfamily domain-containing protein [Xylariaceae sp. FL0804]
MAHGDNAETTPLLGADRAGRASGAGRLFSAANRCLLAGFLISLSFSYTQTPLIYTFRVMVCDEFYGQIPTPAPPLGGGGDRCARSEVEAGTAAQVSIMGSATVVCAILNLFVAGWQMRRWGPRTALALQTFFPVVRVCVQGSSLLVGGRAGITTLQLSQLLTLCGGPGGYIMVLNTTVAEITAPARRTAAFGRLQGSTMLGTALGFFVGGYVAEEVGIGAPFALAAASLAACCVYCLLCVPYVDPKTMSSSSSSSGSGQADDHTKKRLDNKKKQKNKGGVAARLGPFSALGPQRVRLAGGRVATHRGILFLALGIWTGVLATGYAPTLIQMYSMAAFGFNSTNNSLLMSLNCLIRGVFLMFVFPRLIAAGRAWYRARGGEDEGGEVEGEGEGGASSPVDPDPEAQGAGTAANADADAAIAATHTNADAGDDRSADADAIPTEPRDFAPPAPVAAPDTSEPAQTPKPVAPAEGARFDLFFLRWSLLVDGVLTCSSAFATEGWNMYLIACLLPLASGSAAAAKGVLTEMVPPARRADGIQAMMLVEFSATFTTLGVFGAIFSSLSDLGKPYLTFFCNAAVAVIAVFVLLFSRFPPPGSKMLLEEANGEDEEEEDGPEEAEWEGMANDAAEEGPDEAEWEGTANDAADDSIES